MLHRKSSRGFTLVEFVIATAVLVFGVYSIYSGFIGLRIPSQQRLVRARAQWLAHQKLEELRASPHRALAAWTPSAEFARVESEPQFWSKAELGQSAGQAIEISVRVAWNPTTNEEGRRVFDPAQTIEAKGLRSP